MATACGNLYISDSGNQRIRKVTPQGIITTVAGNGQRGYGGDGGAATSASLRYPFGLAVDTGGNLYMADFENHRIRQVSPPAGQPAVLSFSLINADTDQPIKILAPGEAINLAGLPTRNLAIRANASWAAVGSVKLVLSGSQSRSLIENQAPYSVFGDTNGNFRAWTPTLGSYTLRATAYAGADGQGTAGSTLTLAFTVIDQPVIVSYSLINADTDQPIRFITAGEELNLASLPRNLNIRANTSPATVGSVKIVLSPEHRWTTEHPTPCLGTRVATTTPGPQRWGLTP